MRARLFKVFFGGGALFSRKHPLGFNKKGAVVMALSIHRGACKGMNLRMPPGSSARPSGAKLRQAALEMLQPFFEGGSFWDFFAGSGLLGLSAMSLGAREVLFVEKDRHLSKLLQGHIQECQRRLSCQQLPPVAVSLKIGDVASQLRGHPPRTLPWVLWADPPYGEWEKLWWPLFLSFLSKKEIQSSSVLALECGAHQQENFLLPEPWQLWRKRSYGSSALLIWRYQGEASNS